MYEEPCESQPCYKCKYKNYDSLENESYCNHRPLTENLGSWTELDKYGTCEYWELNDLI